MILFLLSIMGFAILTSIAITLVARPGQARSRLFHRCFIVPHSIRRPSTYIDGVYSVVIYVFLGGLLLVSMIFVQPPTIARADGPFTLDWDTVDWPNPGNPPYTTTHTFPIAGLGNGSVTISFNVDQNCIPSLTPPSLDDNTRFAGGTGSESLAIIVQYELAGCTQQFTDVSITFNNMTGVTATIPIYDLDKRLDDNRTDRVVITATDGINTYQANDPGSSFVLGSTIVYTSPSTFTGIGQNQPDDGPNGNLFVTFNQPGIQTITFRYTNPVNQLAQGIGLGDITFFADRVDLDLTKSVNPQTARVGEVVDFVITVTNRGPDDATGVVISDTLPSGYTFLSAVTSQGSYTQPVGLWSVGSLAANNSAALTMTVQVNASGVYTNFAEIQNTDQFDIDSTPGNGIGNGEDDEASASITIPPAQAEADLAISKVSQPRPVVAGETITYTLVVTNYGPSAVNGITIADNLPSEIQSLNYVASRGTFTPSTGAWDVL